VVLAGLAPVGILSLRGGLATVCELQLRRVTYCDRKSLETMKIVDGLPELDLG
jgi:hypothetical protein